MGAQNQLLKRVLAVHWIYRYKTVYGQEDLFMEILSVNINYIRCWFWRQYGKQSFRV